MMITRKIRDTEFIVNPSEAAGIFLKEDNASRYDFTSVKDFSKWIVGGQRIPATVQWEITSYCNFRCKFCFIVGHSESTFFPKTKALEVIKDFSSLGVIHVVLTGGECLLHPDFIDIYLGLKKAGILVTVFSNLENLSLEHLRIFRQYPPYMIEISVYGHNEEVYQEVTGKSSFRKVLSNIEALRENGFNLFCKTPINLLTQDSIAWIQGWCEERGIRYFTSSEIDNGIDGQDLSSFSLSEKDILKQEVLRFKQAEGKRTLIQNENRNTQIAFSCNAGNSGAYLTYDLKLTPCAGIREQFFSVEHSSFASAWEKLVEHIKSQENLRISGCNPLCPAKSICKMCPAKALAGNQDRYRIDPEYCKRMVKLSALLKING